MRTASQPPDPRRLVAALRTSALLAAVPSSALGRLVSSVPPVPLEAGTTLQAHGEPVDAMHVLIKGRAHYFNHTESGPILARDLHAVCCFGERELALGVPAHGTIVAATEVHLLRIDRAHFDALLRGNTAFRRALRASQHPESGHVLRATDDHETRHAEIVALCVPKGWSQAGLARHLAHGLATYLGDQVVLLTVYRSLKAG